MDQNIINSSGPDESQDPSRVTNNQNNQPGKHSDSFADISALRLSQDFSAGAGLIKPLITVPVRKPSKECFVRTHPDQSYRLQTCVVELKEDGETYLVDRALWGDLVAENTFGPRVLITTVSRPGNVISVWSIRLPGADGKLDEWNRSALEIANDYAAKSWVRVVSNRALGAYEAHIAPSTDTWGEPQWPAEKFEDILRRAFKGRFINSLDHPVLKRLRGED